MAGRQWVTLREAWHRSLYGADGFYRREEPADHFRTSAHVGPLLAEAVAELARRLGVESVCDVGAGAGELLSDLAAGTPGLELAGVELRSRPWDLPEAIGWDSRLPESLTGLVLAHEFLDNIPCDVVELAPDGRVRVVEVDPLSDEQRLGDPVGGAEAGWLERWWPLEAEGDRAEVGMPRDAAWEVIRRANPAAWLLAIDFGHLRADRPRFGSWSSYRRGRQTAVHFDRAHDVTAGVAFDAVAATVPGELSRQRVCLQSLGVSGTRPRFDVARTDPAGYLSLLVKATMAAELTSADGLGGFYWLLSAPTASSAAPGAR